MVAASLTRANCVPALRGLGQRIPYDLPIRKTEAILFVHEWPNLQIAILLHLVERFAGSSFSHPTKTNEAQDSRRRLDADCVRLAFAKG
jgi:hypothetical protein